MEGTVVRVTSGIVYKYLQPERVDVLKFGRIRFTQLEALNDPFEGLPCLSEYKNGLRELMVDRCGKKWRPDMAAVLESIMPFLVDDTVDQLPSVVFLTLLYIWRF